MIDKMYIVYLGLVVEITPKRRVLRENPTDGWGTRKKFWVGGGGCETGRSSSQESRSDHTHWTEETPS